MRLAWKLLGRVTLKRHTQRARSVGTSLRAHRVASIGCAFAILTAGAGATTYVKVEGRQTLTAASEPAANVKSDSKPRSSTVPDAKATPPSAQSTRQTGPAHSTSESVTPSARSAASMTVSEPLAGKPFSGIPQVGTLFGVSDGSLTSHHCTGSVVDSPEGDIVITAAHCVYGGSGAETDEAFVPEYDNGSMPYGVWNVSAVYVAPQWAADRDPDYDVALIVVHRSGSNTPIEDVVGADSLAVDQSYTSLTEVVGYPSDTDQPITCTNYTTEFSSTQLRWDCDGYPGGTSGSPFLTGVDPRTGRGTVVGVIGGYQTGGDGPNVSYSVHFGSAVSQLLARAEASG
jgi:V8-like Glu-specific endopeptidase